MESRGGQGGVERSEELVRTSARVAPSPWAEEGEPLAAVSVIEAVIAF